MSHFRLGRFEVSGDSPSGASANASVFVASHYDTVHFWIDQEFLATSDLTTIDETIVHEWVHVGMRDLDISLEAVSDWMPHQTYNNWEERVDHEREGFVDRLARTIVSCYGLRV